jgi:CheY-like chemotaxis protein
MVKVKTRDTMPKILIGDDNPLIRLTLRHLLETQDHWLVVDEAVDGKDAVEKAENRKPDLVILDLAMPRMNGLEATREIKRRHPEVLRELGLSAGASAVVNKSDSGHLISQIRELLGSAAA